MARMGRRCACNLTLHIRADALKYPTLSSSNVIVFTMAINIGLQIYVDDIAMRKALQIQKFIAAEEKYRIYGLSQVMPKDLTFSIDGEKRLV